MLSFCQTCVPEFDSIPKPEVLKSFTISDLFMTNYNGFYMPLPTLLEGIGKHPFLPDLN